MLSHLSKPEDCLKMNTVEFQNGFCNLFPVKGLEYPAVVEFAPFQKIAKKKLKKKDTKTGSIEDGQSFFKCWLVKLPD